MRRITDRQYDFARVPAPNIPRSTFDRSRRHMSAGDAGQLYPFYVDEAYPGDTFQGKAAIFARLATPLHAPMDNLTLETFFFAIPCRLLWENWEKMHGAQDDPADSIDFTVPQFSTGPAGFAHNSIGDYMGLPPGVELDNVNALPFRAYNKVYNDWFRDQNLIDSVVFRTTDSGDGIGDFAIQRRGKRHDYFTACLTSPQKGTAVTMPLGATAPVTIVGTGEPTFDVGGQTKKLRSGGSGDEFNVKWSTPTAPSADSLASWNTPELSGTADLSSATAATINAFREAAAFQQILERSARGGTRYVEIIKAFFGVTSPDFRLQRSEFLGGGSQRVIYNPVPASVTVIGGNDLGDIGAYGTSFGEDHRFVKTFDEHCIVLGLINIRADLTYQQGVHRMWRRESRYDYYLPDLAHLGEQAVLSEEIYADGTAADQNVFGYQERWAELRYGQSQLTSLFRSANPASLDSWHLSEDFATRPVLGKTFIEDQTDTPLDRAQSVATEPNFWFDAYLSLRCARPMPVYSVPGLLRI